MPPRITRMRRSAQSDADENDDDDAADDGEAFGGNVCGGGVGGYLTEEGHARARCIAERSARPFVALGGEGGGGEGGGDDGAADDASMGALARGPLRRVWTQYPGAGDTPHVKRE